MNEVTLRHRLATWLEGAGAILSPGWLDAFKEVPRHVFVPNGTFTFGQPQQLSRTEDYDRWLEAVYHDVGVVTHLDDHGNSRSSSSQPAVMARMLEWLQVEDGNDVLEIGTGSGYNAALLCHRLGAEHVTSIDVLEEAVDAARARLKEIGCEPRLAVADGTQGYPERAPYDRVIGTCYAWPVPRSWLEQTRPGGRVVAVVPTGCVGLEVQEDGSAVGRYHPEPVTFMSMRGYMPEQPPESSLLEKMRGAGETRPYQYPPAILAAGGWSQLSFALLAGAVVAPFEYQWWKSDRAYDNGVSGWLDLGDLSWARFDHERREVTLGGPRRIWDAAEALYEQWCRLGAPNRQRFGLTVWPDGSHVLWLDMPESEHRWELPTTRFSLKSHDQ